MEIQRDLLSNIFQFPISDSTPEDISDNCEENYNRLVATAKKQFPYTDSLWSDEVWDISNKEKKINKRKRSTLYFGLSYKKGSGKSGRTNFNNRYSDLIKAIMTVRFIERGVGVGPQALMLNASRYLYESLGNWNGDLVSINSNAFFEASKLVRENEANSTAYRTGNALKHLSKLFNRFMITPVPIEFNNPFKRDSSCDPLSQRSVDRKSKLFLPEEAIEALVFLDRSVVDKKDRIVVCILKLLMFTGFRISELLSLKASCLILKKENSQEYVGLRYYPAKGGHKIAQVRWFGDISGELIKKTIEELKLITEEFRKGAKWLEDNPGKCLFRKTNPELVGVTTSAISFRKAFIDHDIWRRKGSPKVTIEVLDNLFHDNGKLIFEDRTNGYSVKKSEALLILPKNYFSPTKRDNFWQFEGISHSMLDVRISGKAGTYSSPSIFERYNLKKQDGSPIKISSHMFRRFLNTLYNEGGVPLTVLTKVFGRVNKKDTLAYLYTSPQKRTEQAREMFKNGNMIGPKVDIANSIPINERDTIIDVLTESVHYLGHGFCSHDWSTLPCEKQLNCLDNCVDYHIRKDDPNSKKYLLQQKHWAESSLDSALKELADETFGAQAHVEHYRRILKNVNKYLGKIHEEKKND